MSALAYLEAPCRSQELFTLKWLLRSSGYEIVSTWHDASPTASAAAQAHWTRDQMEELTPFDTLVVLRRDQEDMPAAVGLTVGFAVARRLDVIWIGAPLEPLCQFRNVHSFASVEAYQKHLLLEDKMQAETPARARLVA